MCICVDAGACLLVHRCLTELSFLQLTESSLCNPVSYFIVFYFSSVRLTLDASEIEDEEMPEL